MKGKRASFAPMSSIEMMLGAVDEVEEHYVATVFLHVGVPLFPLRSMYVHSTKVTQFPGGSRISYQGRDLPLVGSSVILGYLRVWLGFATFAMPFVLMWGQSVDFSNWTRWECLATYATAFVWAMTLVPGRLSAQKKKELAVLGQATGTYMDPRRDHMMGRKGVCAMLEPALRAMGGITEPDARGLRAAIPKADPALLAKIYAYARYAAPDSPEYAPVVTEAWSAISRSAR